jgi:rhomboid protease GluP
MFDLRRAPVTAGLLVLITAAFGIEGLTGALANNALLIPLGAITPDALSKHEYWRLLAAMFLHAGWLHFGCNAFSLYQLGTLYENMFGSARFAFMYFVTGLVASIASAMHAQGFSVGASGAIFGILGAFIFSILRSHWRHERWTRSLLSQLIFVGVLNIGIGLNIPIIDNWAHLGGLAAGLLLGLLPHRVPPPPPGNQVIDVRPGEPG